MCVCTRMCVRTACTCARGWWALEVGPSFLVLLRAVSSKFESREKEYQEDWRLAWGQHLFSKKNTMFLKKTAIYYLPCSRQWYVCVYECTLE